MKNNNLEQKYKELEKSFVTYKDLCSVTECDENADKEAFSTLPASGRDVIGRYRFTRDMEHASPNIIVRETVYKKLRAADAALKKENPDWQLAVMYGYRSLDIQEKLFNQIKKELKPLYGNNESELTEAVHRKIAVPEVSGHPTGGAVHVLIYDFVKKAYLDFGVQDGDRETLNDSSRNDSSRNDNSPNDNSAEARKAYYDSPEIAPDSAAKKNRKLLRDVMTAQGFAPYDGDFSHFSYGDKEWAFYSATPHSALHTPHSTLHTPHSKDAPHSKMKYLYKQKNFSDVFFTEKFRASGTAAAFTDTVRIAVQKDGRLTEETVGMLNKSGVEVTAEKGSLFGKSRNFPIELLLVRDDDIPALVDAGAADLGVVGENVYFEKRSVSESVLKLGFGFCSLALAVPESSGMNAARDCAGKRVATSYPNLTADFFDAMGVKGVKIVQISGSVEIAPLINYADAIVDLVSTGSSLRQNKLKFVQKILDSQTVLIANKNVTGAKKAIVDDLVSRINSFLSARKYKYVMMNIPEKARQKVRDVLSAAKALTVSIGPADGAVCPAQAVIEKDSLSATVEALQAAGAVDIVLIDVERSLSR